MSRYEARINLHGTTQRERILNREKNLLLNKSLNSLSCKDVKINGEDDKLIINSGTSTCYKTFCTLPGHSILTGDYVEWMNNVWLVYKADVDNELYIDGDLRQCQEELHWQKNDGTIVSRWAWIQNASSYNNGEEEGRTITLMSNQYLVYMPYDEETKLLDNGKRIHISRFEEVNRPYELTRPDNVNDGYGEKGVIGFIFTQDVIRPEKDKYVEIKDGKKVWLCDYIEPEEPYIPDPNQSQVLSTIKGCDTLRVGFSRTYTVNFTDLDGNEISADDVSFVWNIEGDISNNITAEIDGNKITLTADDDDALVDEKFKLQVIIGDEINGELIITVEEAWG